MSGQKFEFFAGEGGGKDFSDRRNNFSKSSKVWKYFLEIVNMSVVNNMRYGIGKFGIEK